MPGGSKKKARNILNETHSTDFATSRTPVCNMNKHNSMRVEKWRPCVRQGTLKIRRYLFRRQGALQFQLVDSTVHRQGVDLSESIVVLIL